MVSTRLGQLGYWAVLSLVCSTALAENVFTYPTQEGLTFYEKDTVLVSYDSTIANVTLWTFCWEKDENDEQALRTSESNRTGPNRARRMDVSMLLPLGVSKRRPTDIGYYCAEQHLIDAADMDGTQPVVIDFKTDSDKCWFNFRDNDEKQDGANSVEFSMRSQPRDTQTEWGLPKDEDKEPEPTSAPSPSPSSSTTTSSSSSQTSTSASSEPTTGSGRQNGSGSEEQKDEGLSNGAKIGIGVGVGLGVFGIAAAIVGFWLMRRSRRPSATSSAPMQDPNWHGDEGVIKHDPYVYGQQAPTTAPYGSPHAHAPPMYKPAGAAASSAVELPAGTWQSQELPAS